MIRVLLVEDEPPLLRRMQRLFHEHLPGFQVVGSAYDGREAIDLLERTKPDLVVTDLVMPVSDGFDVLRYIRDRHLDILPVILSGHDDFDYARQALRYEVVDYLLKPLSVTDAKAFFQRLSKQIHERRLERQRTYLHALLDEDLPGEPVGPVGLPDASYVVAVVCSGAFLPHCLPASPSAPAEGALLALAPVLLSGEETCWTFSGRYGCDRILVFALRRGSPARVEGLGHKMLLRLGGQGKPVTVALGPAPSAGEIRERLGALYATMRRRMVFGRPNLIVDGSASEAHRTEPVRLLDSDLERRIVYTLRAGRTEELHGVLRDLLAHWEADGVTQLILEKQIKYVVTLAQRSMPLPSGYDVSDVEVEIDEAIQASGGYAELLPRVTHLFDALAEAADDERGAASRTSLVHRVQSYLAGNLAGPFDAQALAERAGLSAGYLGTLFKRNTGFTPMQYLIHQRVERAKVLMHDNPDMLLKDVAEIVGYDDPLYFSRVFKSKTGSWPSAFRSANR